MATALERRQGYKKSKHGQEGSQDKFYQTAEFRKLRDIWYSRLAREGFKDIEYMLDDDGGDYLVGPNPADIRRHYREDKERYYELARQFYEAKCNEDPRWAGSKEGQIWSLHSDGKSFRVIVKLMKRSHIGRWEVAQVVTRLRAELLGTEDAELPDEE